MLHQWHPSVEYEDVDIGSLMLGPKCLSIVGRVVNFFDQRMPSKMPKAAKGCLKMVIKDNTGVLVVCILSVFICGRLDWMIYMG